MTRINQNRLKQMINDMAKFGQLEQGGITRMAFSESYTAAKKYLFDFAQRHQLIFWEDEAYNLHFSLKSKEMIQSTACIITGSHIDTVPNGGPLDGTYGVLAGLEALVSLKEAQVEFSIPIEVVAFNDEEGRFGGMLGSQAMSGSLDVSKLQEAKDRENIALSSVLSALDSTPEQLVKAYRDPKFIHSYLEIHIEQGPTLESEQNTIGIVSGISGLKKYRVCLKGQAAHAGTTPMHLRKDPVAGFSCFHQELLKNLPKDVLATVGSLTVSPGAANVVADTVDFSIDMRSLDENRLESFANETKQLLDNICQRHKLDYSIKLESQFAPLPCNAKIMHIITENAKKLQLTHQVLPSGAIHDALEMGRNNVFGMIFVPSIAGISHNPKEWTDWGDLFSGCELLLHVLRELSTMEKI